MQFSRLKEIFKGTLELFHDTELGHFCFDSRTASGHANEVFIALQGKRDGNDFANEAHGKGVRNFILSKPVNLPESNVFLVNEPLQLLQKLAASHRAAANFPVVAITGSNGKTTVKEWLSTILQQRYFVVKSPRSYNSQLGVPMSLLEMKKFHEVGVFEAGISQRGEMGKLLEMVRPTIGVFTNLGEAHEDGFASRSEKLKEKLKLFSTSSRVIIRGDRSYSAAAVEILKEKAITWSLQGDAPYNVRWEKDKINVNEYAISCGFHTDPMLENLTHVVITALELGLSAKEIQRGVDQLESVPMRLEFKRAVNGCYLLDDTYNNDFAGLRAALDHLKSQSENANKTLVLSDILHSARSDKELYREVASLLEAHQITRLIGVGKRISSCSALFPMQKEFYPSAADLLQKRPLFDREMILVKGAREFALERVVSWLEDKTHGTILEVNFEHLAHNLNQYRSLLQPKTLLMVMVKANAYGNGLLEVSNFLQYQRVDLLGVAYVDEAVQLRKNGITIPIMIMNPFIDSFEKFERFDLQAEIFSIRHFDRMIADTSEPLKIHIKIDTGMHRLGFSEHEIPALIERLKANPRIQIVGIFTHFASADDKNEDAFTKEQAASFDKIYEKITSAIGYRPTRHLCNSAGIVRWPEYHHEMVRLGVGLYGFDVTSSLKLRFPASLKTVVSQLQVLQKGDTVGYSRKGKITKDSEIAVLPIGYEDGFLRVFGNGVGQVYINGHMCPVVGNVCMDMTMVDVTGLKVSEGEEVVIFGNQPTIKELAQWTNTIPYEILTNVSSRVKRVFVSN